jgi:hypothetical protein
VFQLAQSVHRCCRTQRFEATLSHPGVSKALRGLQPSNFKLNSCVHFLSSPMAFVVDGSAVFSDCC